MKWLRPKRETDSAHGRLEDIFRLFSKDLHQYVRRRLDHPADSADLTQEIFERFIRGDREARIRTPHAYLFGIASHVVAEARMAKRKSPVTYDSEVSAKAAATLASAGTEETADVMQEELARVLDRLTDTQRAALLLTKRDGLSCKEAAIRMGTSEGSVRVYVCEARAQLKMLLRNR